MKQEDRQRLLSILKGYLDSIENKDGWIGIALEDIWSEMDKDVDWTELGKAEEHIGSHIEDIERKTMRGLRCEFESLFSKVSTDAAYISKTVNEFLAEELGMQITRKRVAQILQAYVVNDKTNSVYVALRDIGAKLSKENMSGSADIEAETMNGLICEIDKLCLKVKQDSSYESKTVNEFLAEELGQQMPKHKNAFKMT